MVSSLLYPQLMDQGKNKYVEKASPEQGYQNQTQVTTVWVLDGPVPLLEALKAEFFLSLTPFKKEAGS